MTVAIDLNKVTYTGNGVTTVFPFSFRVDQASDLQAYLLDIATFGLTLLTQGVDYTVAGIPGAGSVTYNPLGVPMTSAKKLILLRMVGILQSLDINNQGGFLPEVLEAQLDTIVMGIQQLEEGLGRSVQAPLGQSGQALPAPAANKVIAWDALGTTLVSVTLAAVTVAMPITANRYLRNDAAGNPAVISAAQTTVLDTISTTATAYGQSLLTSVAAPDLRLAGVVPTYTTLAALRGLDTTKDGMAFLTDVNIGDWFKWDGSDLSATRTVLQSLTTTTVVAATNICTKVAHLLSTGSGILATTAVNGLSLNTVYWVRAIDADTFTLHPTPLDAYNNTNIFDLTGSTNFTLKQLRDPAQNVYVIKTGGQLDGSGGAWVRSNGGVNFGISGISYKRFADRVLFGRGAANWMGDTAGLSSTGVGSWLGDEIAPGSAYAMSYLLVGANVASVPDYTAGQPTIGLFGASRTPDGAANTNFMGLAAFASGHATSGSSIGWAGYFEAVKRPGSNSTLQTLELEITNLNLTPVNPVISSESTYVQGRTFGIFLASGGGNTTTYDADSAIFIGSNVSAFRTGITFFKNSLTKDAGTNYQHAIILPNKARIEWDTSDGNANDGFTIHSEVSNAAHQIFMVASDAGLALINTGGKIIWNAAYVASAVNYIAYSPGAAGAGPNYQVLGDDANADMSLIGRGTGGIRLRDGAANDKIKVNTTGIGFFNATPVARGAQAALTGTIQRGTFDTSTVTLPQLAGVVMAIVNDLRAYGLSS